MTIELHCLDAVTDDYENIESIERLVSRDTDEQIVRRVLTTVIESLCQRGLITAYRYDIRSQQFIPEHFCPRENVESFWFYISAEGRAFLKSEWKE